MLPVGRELVRPPRPGHAACVDERAGVALDFVDGWVARWTRTTATLGASFDGEVDAFLIRVLSMYVARSVGVLVLAIGAARYAFLAAGWPLPWMRARLPPRYWRKVVAATQGIVLHDRGRGCPAAAGEPGDPGRGPPPAGLVVRARRLVAVIHRQAKGTTGSDVGVAAPAGGPGPTAQDYRCRVLGPGRSVRFGGLVAPNQAQDLTVTAFLRVPIEGLVLVALAAVLPTIPRRILAGWSVRRSRCWSS